MATELRLGLPGTPSTNSNSKKRPLTAPEPPPAKKNSVMKKSREEMYVKVSMEGAPYLWTIDLKVYEGYGQLLEGLESMFNTLTYQDKDGDWMLLGDVPWDMFLPSCNKLRIVKGSQQ